MKIELVTIYICTVCSSNRIKDMVAKNVPQVFRMYKDVPKDLYAVLKFPHSFLENLLVRLILLPTKTCIYMMTLTLKSQLSISEQYIIYMYCLWYW